MATLANPNSTEPSASISKVRKTSIPVHLWPAIIVTYAAVLPQELAINLAGAALFPYRLCLLVSIPWLLQNFFSGRLRGHPVDALAVLVSVWLTISISVHEPIGKALEFGLANAIDFGLAYFAGRVSIRNTSDLKTYVRAILPLAAGLAVLLMLESVLQRHLLRPALAQAFGNPPPAIHQQTRLGLYRAAGPFPHPILGGVFLASLLPLAIFAARKMVWRILGVFAACSMIFTVSSTAILTFLLGLALITILWFQRASRGPIIILSVIAATTAFVTISVVSDSGPFTFAIYRFTLDPASGYWRLLIWEYAGAEALANPVFGIGLRDWFRPPFMITSSIDAHFLLWAMRYGMIAGIGCLAVFLGAALYLLWGSRGQTSQARNVSIGLSICLVCLTFSGFSVAFWGGLAAWAYMLCGAAISIGTPKFAVLLPPQQAYSKIANPTRAGAD